MAVIVPEITHHSIGGIIMRIVVIGASGAVGKTAVEALSPRHEIISVGRSSGEVQVDMEDLDSIRAMYQQVGKIDAVVSAVGHGYFGAVHEMTSEQFLEEKKKVKLHTLPESTMTADWEHLPAEFCDLVRRSLNLQNRITVIDSEVYEMKHAESEETNPVRQQLDLLSTALGASRKLN